jgi:hypothetical protein
VLRRVRMDVMPHARRQAGRIQVRRMAARSSQPAPHRSARTAGALSKGDACCWLSSCAGQPLSARVSVTETSSGREHLRSRHRVGRLRHKLEADPKVPRVIKTERGVSYALQFLSNKPVGGLAQRTANRRWSGQAASRLRRTLRFEL